ncbi:MAG TPA: DUF2804 family protein [Solirubrobacterales bacterium]|nr:DUF2804 family protein [Solirubrobacterales bacterium]
MDPATLPLRDHGQLRKRWRYVGLFAEELMLCAARAEVGPFRQSFWVLWDREQRRQWTHTALRPGSREVVLDGPRLEIEAADLRASLRLGEAEPVEVTCPSGRSWAWTRKRAGLPIEGTVEVPGRRWEVAGRGVDDESAGYHARRTSWHWSAGVGESVDGRALAWNLVEGINDPPSGSERAIWVEGKPTEPPPVRFEGMAAVALDGGEALHFASESEHAKDDNFLLVRSRYRHGFGAFTGSLGGFELAEGYGVMEEHEALW